MAPTLILLLSALLHATWNAMIKKHPEPRRFTSVVLAMAALFSAGSIPALSAGAAPLSEKALLWSLAAGAFEGAYFYFLASALTKAPLGTAYAVIRGGAMAAVWTISASLLGEPFGLRGFSGALLALLSLVLINGHAPSSMGRRADYRPAYVAALCVAGYHLCYGQALGGGANPALVFSIAMVTAIPMNLAAGCFRFMPHLSAELRGRRLRLLVVTGAICAFSFLFFLTGLAHTGAGAAITIRNTSIIFAQLFAAAFGERLSPLQWGGVVCAFAGVTLMAPH